MSKQRFVYTGVTDDEEEEVEESDQDEKPFNIFKK